MRSPPLIPNPQPPTPDEDFVAWLWQRHLGGGRWLEPAGCRPLRVVYPGERQRGRGPDFREALLATREGELLHGDVEVHLRASDWQAHGHQRDAGYNATLLHVVWVADRPALPRRCDGAPVPQLDLSACLARPLGELLVAYRGSRDTPAELPCWSPAEAGPHLEAAGLARFQARATACQGDVMALGVEQALYRRLAAALGYGANQGPFLRLADLVPLVEVRTWVEAVGAEGAAERLLDWAGLGERLVPGGLAAGEWVLAGVRPGNLPPRRIRALCHLVARYGDALAPSLAEAVLQAWQARRPAALAALLSVSQELVGRASPPAVAGGDARPTDGTLRVPALVGAARARDMAVNALLPWAFAWGEVAGRVALQRAASGCYQAHPRCAENHVTREAARLLGLNPRVARTACQQQGLLHLYRQRLHRPECWRQDPDGRWRWRPWVEALDRVDSRQLTVERAPADCQLWTVDCGLDLDAAVPAALPAAG